MDFHIIITVTFCKEESTNIFRKSDYYKFSNNNIFDDFPIYTVTNNNSLKYEFQIINIYLILVLKTRKKNEISNSILGLVYTEGLFYLLRKYKIQT